MNQLTSDHSCLAIDFGTTATAAALSVAGREQLVEVDGSPRMPSIICWRAPLGGEDGRLLLGEAAENEAVLAPHCVERCPKRKLAQEFIFLGDTRIQVTEAVAQIFLHVLWEASARLGGRGPAELRLTHPAQWAETKLGKLREAAAGAGFAQAQLMPEPVGAAVYFANELLQAGEHVAVYDLGGGTFDTAVLLRTDNGFEVVGVPGGREDLGGEDFDDRLYQFLGAQLDPDHWRTLTSAQADLRWQRAHHDFQREVRRAKERLSKYADATVRSPIPGESDLRVSATEFESLIRHDVSGTVDELQRTIEASGQSASTLSAIYLAGGSSRIPLVSKLVEERFGRKPSLLGDPKAVIALGAARAYARQGTRRTTPSGSPSAQVVVKQGARSPAAPASSPPRRRTTGRTLARRSSAAAAATSIASASGLLAAFADGLLLVDALRARAPSGLSVAAALGVVSWMLFATASGMACATFLRPARDRSAAFRYAVLVLAAGFGCAFLGEVASVVSYAVRGGQSAFIAAHSASALSELLAGVAAGIAAVGLTRARGRKPDASFGWASAIVAAGLLLLALSSILNLVTFATARAPAALTGGIGAQIAGSALAAGSMLIVACAFLIPTRDRTVGQARRWTFLAVGAAALALAFLITALGSGMQTTASTGLDARTAAAGWLAVGREVGWAAACWIAAVGFARCI